MMYHLPSNRSGSNLFENTKRDINKELETIQTKSIQAKVQPLLAQVIALLHHKCCTTNFPPALNVSTDHTIHVVSGTVSQTVQTGRAVAVKNTRLKKDLEATCQEAISAGESLCRLLTQQSNQRLSPSSSQTGTDSGVEDIDDESGSEILHALSHDEERLNLHQWILNDLRDTRGQSNHPLNLLGNDDISSTTSYSDDDIKLSELASACLTVLKSVIRVLVVADQVKIMEIRDSAEGVLESLDRMKTSIDFHKFMQEFSAFGNRIIQLAELTGRRQQDLLKDVDKSHILSSRSVLEKGTSLCLVTSKLCFQHSSSCLARKCRDHCFERMRFALKLMTDVVQTSVGWRQTSLPSIHLVPQHSNDIIGLETSLVKCTLNESNCNLLQGNTTLFKLLGFLKDHKTGRKPSENYDGIHDGFINKATSHLRAYSEEKQLNEISDHLKKFTNHSYISYEDQIRIKRAHCALENTVQSLATYEKDMLHRGDASASEDMIYKKAILVVDEVAALEDMIRVAVISQLHDVTMMLTKTHSTNNEISLILRNLSKEDLCRNNENCERIVKTFKDISKRAHKACCLARECFSDPSLIVTTDHIIEGVNDLTEQVSTSVHIAQSLGDSQLAFENLQLFATQWQHSLVTDLDILVSALTRPTSGTNGQDPPDKMGFQSIKEHTTVARLGLEIKLLSGQCRSEYEHWSRLPSDGHANHMLAGVRKIFESAWNIFQFTKGQPPLLTTADLFTCITEINNYADEYAHHSSAILNNSTEYVTVPGKLLTSVSSSNLQIISACECLRTSLRIGVRGKAAVVQKVMTSLQKLKTVLSLVCKLTISLHSVWLEKSLLSKTSVNHGSLSNTARPHHRSMTSRTMTKVVPEISVSHIGNSSQERT